MHDTNRYTPSGRSQILATACTCGWTSGRGMVTFLQWSVNTAQSYLLVSNYGRGYPIPSHGVVDSPTHVLQKKVRVCSCIAWYPVRRTAQSVLQFTPWQTCSFQRNLNFSGKHSAKTIRSHFHNCPVLPGTHLYSCVNCGNVGVIKLVKGSKRPQWNLKPGSLD